jgi:hypothetical protein
MPTTGFAPDFGKNQSASFFWVDQRLAARSMLPSEMWEGCCRGVLRRCYKSRNDPHVERRIIGHDRTMMVMMGYEADVPYTSVMDDPFLPFFPEPNFGRVRAPHSRADPLERLWLERNAFRKHLLPFVHEMFGPEVVWLGKKLLVYWQDDGMLSTENDFRQWIHVLSLASIVAAGRDFARRLSREVQSIIVQSRRHAIAHLSVLPLLCRSINCPRFIPDDDLFVEEGGVSSCPSQLLLA